MKAKLDDYKNRIDGMFHHHKDNYAGLFLQIESVLAPKFKTTNELRVELRNELIYSINKTSIEAIINRRRDQYQKEIDSINNFDPSLRYKLTNERDFTLKHMDNEENLCLKVCHSKALRNLANNSHLKKIVARTLDKMKISYIKNFCDYPLSADFLLFPENQAKIVIQVIY